jgi:phytanoyl-CoA hydroxylase
MCIYRPLHSSREEGHAVEVEMYKTDIIEPACVKRGSCSIHDEYIVHGSGGNDSDGDRRTYVMAFRPKKTVEKERKIGFTHSHNDKVNWDTFKSLENDKLTIPDASSKK